MLGFVPKLCFSSTFRSMGRSLGGYMELYVGLSSDIGLEITGAYAGEYVSHSLGEDAKP